MRTVEPRSHESDRQLLADSQLRQVKSASSVIEMQKELEGIYDRSKKAQKVKIMLGTILAVGSIFLGWRNIKGFYKIAALAVGGTILLGSAIKAAGMVQNIKSEAEAKSQLRKILTNDSVKTQIREEDKEIQRKSAKMAIDVMRKTRMVDEMTIERKRKELQMTRIPISAEIKEAVLEEPR